MPKTSLGMLKNILETVVLILGLSVPIYGYYTNLMSEFEKGLFIGSVSMSALALAVVWIFDLWTVDIGSVNDRVIAYIRKNVPDSLNLVVQELTFDKNSGQWHIIGRFDRKDAREQVEYRFEFAVNARTGKLERQLIEFR